MRERHSEHSRRLPLVVTAHAHTSINCVAKLVKFSVITRLDQPKCNVQPHLEKNLCYQVFSYGSITRRHW